MASGLTFLHQKQYFLLPGDLEEKDELMNQLVTEGADTHMDVAAYILNRPRGTKYGNCCYEGVCHRLRRLVKTAVSGYGK